jgi:hypothetical protein
LRQQRRYSHIPKSTQLIGDPAAFAINFSDIARLGEATYGRCALWLGGYPLRDADAPVCLDTVLACLQGVASTEALPGLVTDALSSPMQMLRWMQERAEIHKHFFLDIEGFDDFLKLFSKDAKSTYLHWALHPQVAHLSIYDDYPKGVQQLIIGNMELQRAFDQFAKELEVAKAQTMPLTS